VSRQLFTLRPFQGDAEDAPDIQITGSIARGPEAVAINYQITGKCAALYFPKMTGVPERRDFLWKTTCFELFIKEADAEGYLEINLSPAGHWNIYRFDGYRTGMREELRVAAPAVQVDDRKPDIWTISTEIHINNIMAAGQPFQAAVSVVVKTVTGHLSYWALTHPGVEPDFHHRDSFVIKLQGSSSCGKP
jgi:hypothetical protein